MSAYIVEENHILYLVAIAMSPRVNRHGSNFSYYWNGERHEIRIGDDAAGARIANMLWLENALSVGTRYPKGSSANLPGPHDGIRELSAHDLRTIVEFNPVQVFKSIDCYSYQTCEHAGWEASEARAFCATLRKLVCCTMDGYDEAE